MSALGCFTLHVMWLCISQLTTARWVFVGLGCVGGWGRGGVGGTHSLRQREFLQLQFFFEPAPPVRALGLDDRGRGVECGADTGVVAGGRPPAAAAATPPAGLRAAANCCGVIPGKRKGA